MNARWLLLTFCLLIMIAFAPTPAVHIANAQDAATDVWVTTQDFSSLRLGPGRAFDRITVVPPTTTLPAVGRTADTQWIQVEYEGRTGWIASLLLVWTGDVINLPVDGVNPEPFIRRAAALAVTIRETPYYESFTTMLPGYELGMIPEDTTLELTGRVGERGYLRVQARYGDALVWMGTQNLRVVDGNLFRLLDLSYLFTYGRLFQTLQSSLATALTSYRQISDVWQRISRGDQVACAPVPPRVSRRLVDTDVSREPTFEAAVLALDSAIEAINSAISAFEDACAPGFVLTRAYVDVQLATLAEAERFLIFAGSLIEPLRSRNPLN
jgi:hypothetical protein